MGRVWGDGCRGRGYSMGGAGRRSLRTTPKPCTSSSAPSPHLPLPPVPPTPPYSSPRQVLARANAARPNRGGPCPAPTPTPASRGRHKRSPNLSSPHTATHSSAVLRGHNHTEFPALMHAAPSPRPHPLGGAEQWRAGTSSSHASAHWGRGAELAAADWLRRAPLNRSESL